MRWGIAFLIAAALALSSAARADTILDYTVPAREAPYDCDSVRVVCNPVGVCDTTVHHGAEVMGFTRVWWWPRWAAAPYLMRSKNVAGLEGQNDTLRVPSDTVATVYLTFRDAAGNGSDLCRTNYVTVNAAAVSVDAPGPPGQLELRWYDIAGRRLTDLDGMHEAQVRRYARAGVYLLREIVNGAARPKKVVVVR